jgi:hypothetical protein
MRQAGRESWRFAHDIDQSLHALLYVRDTLDLGIDRYRTAMRPWNLVASWFVKKAWTAR